MKGYVGIDLGTTNSAICTYDGKETHIWKSPEQTDVTPSAIYIDRRGNRYYGQKAYNQSAFNPANSATLFKRFIGTDTTISFEDAGITMSPEECSAEILRVLFGYLPDEIRNDPETGTVITVPAAFSVMKKDATMEAARMAGIGRVALMQEPVAAVMSILKESPEDGLFLVYDLGGGTFDVSIAENIGGRVSMLAHGGIEICGGRDIDRKLFDQIVLPWLRKNFSLPGDLSGNKKYSKIIRIAHWAAERAKIELSYAETSTIAMTEDEIRCEDEEGNEIYFDIDITREQLDSLMSGIISDTVRAARDTISKAGLRTEDILKVVFIGGPTVYAPLREKVSAALGIATNTGVNPMTAVAEGAAVFAESIEWSDESHNRKKQDGAIEIDADVTLKYISRTPADSAKVMLITNGTYDDHFVQFECTDTGWVSGRMPALDKTTADLPLTMKGENHFIAVFTDSLGRAAGREPEKIVITRTMATVSAIPASQSIGIEVQNRLGGDTELVFLVREGDSLPHKGVIRVKAGITLKAGSHDSLNIKLWEGNITSRIDDNRFIGVLKIKGTDIEAGVIPTGADIDIEYEIADSGQISLEASVPYIAAAFKGNNLYSRQEGAKYIDKDKIAEAGERLAEEIAGMIGAIPSDELYYAKEKAQNAAAARYYHNEDKELIQKADNDLQEARRIAGRYRREHESTVRQTRLSKEKKYYKINIEPFADDGERKEMANHFRTAEQSAAGSGEYFEEIMEDISNLEWTILWRQDWYVIRVYESKKRRGESGYVNAEKFRKLKAQGDQAVADNDIDELKRVLFRLSEIQVRTAKDHTDENDLFDKANILRG